MWYTITKFILRSCHLLDCIVSLQKALNIIQSPIQTNSLMHVSYYTQIPKWLTLKIRSKVRTKRQMNSSPSVAPHGRTILSARVRISEDQVREDGNSMNASRWRSAIIKVTNLETNHDEINQLEGKVLNSFNPVSQHQYDVEPQPIDRSRLYSTVLCHYNVYISVVKKETHTHT